ncbi:hypothetical protein CGCF415_v013757 [Colletotrichum fructicola]|uniref:Uncharacterized protein n=1 Tax=Colletotrichum fructicola (strain Nara gc5) TaxID=1213859 RepID=A0A7J6J3L3_COLFN|nr:hypothetical protein CGGC5_v007980 [Colletotrichum fructicola Nara gc5]KAF4807262.1 hypothetical protein CGCSCA5_v013550 [Colletotrichum siamense]KAF4885318.1 hypothetical protein CGCFRS4_v012044 [Colletotrichum fructicola]KAF4879894.1 hypothetical protein CGCSCA1_v001332 [Colletotrichum siamense]KAF4890372.1 hypothetical protein CGCF415_v013757 [Colletotrichum fructicola]
MSDVWPTNYSNKRQKILFMRNIGRNLADPDCVEPHETCPVRRYQIEGVKTRSISRPFEFCWELDVLFRRPHRFLFTSISA